MESVDPRGAAEHLVACELPLSFLIVCLDDGCAVENDA